MLEYKKPEQQALSVLRTIIPAARWQPQRKEIPMKKIICKVEYDTEASELINKRTFGYFGDPAGYEESLYKTEGGKFFLYTFGGAESKYAKEAITRMSAAKADEWLAAK